MSDLWWMSWTIRVDRVIQDLSSETSASVAHYLPSWHTMPSIQPDSVTRQRLVSSITPATWPPPDCVLGYWLVEDVGGEAKIRALCRGNESTIKAQIEEAWPTFVKWTLTKRRGSNVPVESPYSAPAWSIELGRWPWPMEEDPKLVD